MCLRVNDDWLQSRVTDKEIVCYKVDLSKNDMVVAPFYDEHYRFYGALSCRTLSNS